MPEEALLGLLVGSPSTFTFGLALKQRIHHVGDGYRCPQVTRAVTSDLELGPMTEVFCPAVDGIVFDSSAMNINGDGLFSAVALHPVGPPGVAPKRLPRDGTRAADETWFEYLCICGLVLLVRKAGLKFVA